MSNILFYTPFDQRARDVESLMLAFQKQGHTIFFLSQKDGPELRELLAQRGIRASSHLVRGRQDGWWYFLRHLFFFVSYCGRNKISVVYSHLEPANFVASIGQFFIAARTFLCRHHVDEGQWAQFDQSYYYRLTYRLARKIIVVSNRAVNHMVDKESIPPRKIIHINLAYDFGLFESPDRKRVEEIRENISSEILLLAICRLTESKRPEIAIQLAHALRNQGLQVKLILLGRGERVEELKSLIGNMNLDGSVILPGYVNNVQDYIAAADFLVHPSLSESSCVVVKEAGLVGKPVIVCKGVGDFDEYIVNGENGFLVSPDDFVEASSEIISRYRLMEQLHLIGERLRKSVLERFDVRNVLDQYAVLNES